MKNPERYEPYYAQRRNDRYRPAYALARGADAGEPRTFQWRSATSQLGPYETQYEVAHGYSVERDIVRP